MARSERMVGALWGSSITVICSYFSLISKLGRGRYDVHIDHDLHHNHVVCYEEHHDDDLLWRGDLAAVDSGRSEVHFLQDYLTWFASVLKMITILPLTVTIPLVLINSHWILTSTLIPGTSKIWIGFWLFHGWYLRKSPSFLLHFLQDNVFPDNDCETIRMIAHYIFNL